MELFIRVAFWIGFVGIFLRIFIMAMNAHGKPTSLPVYAADTVLKAVFTIWAGFLLWHS